MRSKLLRYCTTLAAFHMASLFLQPVFAGMILSGMGGDPLLLHRLNGQTAFFLCLLMLAGLVLAWRRGFLAATYPVLAAAILVCEAAQFHFGYTANLLLHIPLGVFVVAGSALLTYVLAAIRRPATDMLP